MEREKRNNAICKECGKTLSKYGYVEYIDYEQVVEEVCCGQEGNYKMKKVDIGLFCNGKCLCDYINKKSEKN